MEEMCLEIHAPRIVYMTPIPNHNMTSRSDKGHNSRSQTSLLCCDICLPSPLDRTPSSDRSPPFPPDIAHMMNSNRLSCFPDIPDIRHNHSAPPPPDMSHPSICICLHGISSPLRMPDIRLRHEFPPAGMTLQHIFHLDMSSRLRTHGILVRH